MRQSWRVGRAVHCPPHDRSAALIPLPIQEGGQRNARLAFPDPPMTKHCLLHFKFAFSGCSSSAETRRTQRKPQKSVKKQADRKSTRLNSSHLGISYAVFC